jgi:two-component system, OmpR family, sensor histidine kinase BaeS
VPAETDPATLPPPPPGVPATRLPPPLEVSGRQLTAVVTAATAGTLLVYGRAPGVAWTLAAVLVGGAVLVARRSAADRPRPDRWHLAAGATALGLAALPVLTDAGWVVGLALIAAAGLATLAVAGGATWRALVLPGVRTVPVACTGVAAAVRRIGRLASHAPTAARHVRTALLTGVLVLLFGGLFASADAAFDRLVGMLVPDLSLDGLVGRAVLGTVLGTVTLTLVLLRRVPADDDDQPARRHLTGSEWLTPLAALVLLFTAFIAVQIGTSFGGDAFVQRTAGLTYAAYAREGFAQLLVVAVLTLGVIALTSRYALARSAREERLRRGLLAGLCVLTLVVLASAFHRLSLYESAFGFTTARVTAHATILWLAALFVLVLALGAARRAEHLPRSAVLLTGVALLAFGLAQPEAIVARGNVDRFAATGQLDVWTLQYLSADAAPALAELPPEVAACIGAPSGSPDTGDDPLAWNRSRARAATLPPLRDVPCQEPPGGSYP